MRYSKAHVFPAPAMVVALATVVGASRPARAQSAPAAAPAPCQADSARRRLDFWAGEWKVETPDGKAAGHSVVEPISGGCGLLENWTDLQGGTGKSLNAYNPTLHRWQQFWVGQYGAVNEYRDSEWHGDTLVYRAESVNAAGRPIALRLSFNPRADGSVRQFGEVSTDGGKTWKVSYEFFYRRAR
ncbi:MAG TPA: hypothetical protein VHB25_19420 [Gemmatimonadaceae bacterium]|nr:hypothetical protein [Gemmatimonadaceae bacterium]